MLTLRKKGERPHLVSVKEGSKRRGGKYFLFSLGKQGKKKVKGALQSPFTGGRREQSCEGIGRGGKTSQKRGGSAETLLVR